MPSTSVPSRQIEQLEPFRQRRMAQLVLGGWRFELDEGSGYWSAHPPAWGRRSLGSETLPATIDRAWIFTLQSEQI